MEFIFGIKVKKIFLIFFCFLTFLIPDRFIFCNQDIDQNSIVVTSNWKASSWFGYYYDNGSEWIYHEDLEWVYPSSEDGTSVWLFLPSLDWAWTQQEHFPWIYFHKLQNWRYYDSTGGFYNFETLSWTPKEEFELELKNLEDGTGGQESNSTNGDNGTTDSNQTSSNSFVLTVHSSTGGSVTGGGIYSPGDTATIRASPDTGYEFLSWVGAEVGDSVAKTTSIIVDQNLSVTASFSLADYTLELIAGLGGSVIGAGIYEYGKSVSISANPNPGYYLENWTGATLADSTALTTTILIDQNHSLRANFSRVQPILSITHGLGGTVSGGGSYDYDSNVSIIATPENGYYFLHWSGAQVANSSAATTTIHLTEDSNLTATFEANSTSSLSKIDPYEMVRRMGRGINLGNVLSAPEEGKWAPAATQQYFIDLKDANFSNVRLPTDFYGTRTTGDTSMFSTLSGTSADFNGSMDDFVVSSAYLDRIEEIITWSLNLGLITVLDFHGANLKSEFLHTFNPSSSDYIEPTSARRAADLVKFQSIWRAIANRFRDYPPELLFEVVNEPYFELSAAEMDQLNALIISVIRATGGNNADRNLILVGGGENSYLAPQQIDASILASDDQLIATFHYYDPFSFTSSQKDQYDDNDWGTVEDIESIQTHFDTVKSWSEANQIPIYLGEFGADNVGGYDYGSGTLRKINSNTTGYADGGPDSESRLLYHQQVAEEAMNRGFAFSVWDSGPTSNKTIHKRKDSNLTSNFDFTSFAVSSYEEPTVTVSTVVDSTTWVSEIKDAILNHGTWPGCYGPLGVIKNPRFECSPYDEGWSLKLVSGSTAEISDGGSSISRTGNSAMQIKVSSDLGYNKVLLENTAFVSDLNGQRITVECWIRSSVPAEFRMQLKITEKEGVDYGNKFPSSDIFSTTTEYQKFIFRHTVSNPIDGVQFKLLLGKTPATFFVDDCSAVVE